MTLADTINGAGVVLRRYRESDIEDVIAACNDPLTVRFLHQLPHPCTREHAQHWVTEGSVAAVPEGGGGYAVADPVSDRLLGAVGIRPHRDGEGEIGYWVAPWARRRGVASAATEALTAHAFITGAQRLVLRTAFDNTASQRVALRTGYQRDGVERGGARTRAGAREDMIAWARLASDPPGPTPRRLPDLPGYGPDGLGELADDLIVLRPLVAGDIDDTYALRTLAEVVASSVPPHPPNRAAVTERCVRAQAHWLAGDRADFTIRDRATGAHAGEIGFSYSQPALQQAMIGYSMRREWRGKGYATRAARLVADWGLQAVGVHRVIAGTAPTNTGSQRVLERAGFVREGYQRELLPGPNGTRIDDILYARLA